MVVGEPALWSKGICVSKGAEEAIPPGDVAVVELVNIQLMMNGMMLGPLEKVAHPMRSPQIAVIEIFTEYGKDVEPGASGW